MQNRSSYLLGHLNMLSSSCFCRDLFCKIMTWYRSRKTSTGVARHPTQTDVAACWRNLAGAAATGAEGCNSLLLPNLQKNVGRHGNGSTVMCQTLSLLNSGGGAGNGATTSPLVGVSSLVTG